MPLQKQSETKESLDSEREDACVLLTSKSQTLKANSTEVKTPKKYPTEWKKTKKDEYLKSCLDRCQHFSHLVNSVDGLAEDCWVYP